MSHNYSTRKKLADLIFRPTLTYVVIQSFQKKKKKKTINKNKNNSNKSKNKKHCFLKIIAFYGPQKKKHFYQLFIKFSDVNRKFKHLAHS